MTRTIKRGDIVYYDFGPNNGSVQGGMRPAVVLQNDTRNKQSPTTIVAPLTTELKKLGMYSHIVLGKRFGLKQNSMILLEQLVTVNQASFGEYIGTIDDPTIRHMINVGLRKVLAIQGKPLPRYLKKIEPKPQKKPVYSERDIVCLCHSCRDTYRELGYKVVYIGGNADNCSICGYHRGFDHAVVGILTRK